MPNILVSRLFLNLKTFDDPKNGFSTSSLPPPIFAQDRLLGNIGAPLDSRQWDHDEDLGDEEEEGNILICGTDALTTLVPVVRFSFLQ